IIHPLVSFNAGFQGIRTFQTEGACLLVEILCRIDKIFNAHAQSEIFDRLQIDLFKIFLREMVTKFFREYSAFNHMTTSITIINFILPKTGAPVTPVYFNISMISSVCALTEDRSFSL